MALACSRYAHAVASSTWPRARSAKIKRRGRYDEAAKAIREGKRPRRTRDEAAAGALEAMQKVKKPRRNRDEETRAASETTHPGRPTALRTRRTRVLATSAARRPDSRRAGARRWPAGSLFGGAEPGRALRLPGAGGGPCSSNRPPRERTPRLNLHAQRSSCRRGKGAEILAQRNPQRTQPDKLTAQSLPLRGLLLNARD